MTAGRKARRCREARSARPARGGACAAAPCAAARARPSVARSGRRCSMRRRDPPTGPRCAAAIACRSRRPSCTSRAHAPAARAAGGGAAGRKRCAPAGSAPWAARPSARGRATSSRAAAPAAARADRATPDEPRIAASPGSPAPCRRRAPPRRHPHARRRARAIGAATGGSVCLDRSLHGRHQLRAQAGWWRAVAPDESGAHGHEEAAVGLEALGPVARVVAVTVARAKQPVELRLVVADIGRPQRALRPLADERHRAPCRAEEERARVEDGVGLAVASKVRVVVGREHICEREQPCVRRAAIDTTAADPGPRVAQPDRVRVRQQHIVPAPEQAEREARLHEAQQLEALSLVAHVPLRRQQAAQLRGRLSGLRVVTQQRRRVEHRLAPAQAESQHLVVDGDCRVRPQR
eukprot:2187315-Prymnesium_polylepis.1